MRQKDKETLGSEFKFYIFLHNLYLPTVQEAENILDLMNLKVYYSLAVIHSCIIRKKKLPHEVSLCSGSQPGTDGKYCSRLLVWPGEIGELSPVLSFEVNLTDNKNLGKGERCLCKIFPISCGISGDT